MSPKEKSQAFVFKCEKYNTFSYVMDMFLKLHRFIGYDTHEEFFAPGQETPFPYATRH